MMDGGGMMFGEIIGIVVGVLLVVNLFSTGEIKKDDPKHVLADISKWVTLEEKCNCVIITIRPTMWIISSMNVYPTLGLYVCETRKCTIKNQISFL